MTDERKDVVAQDVDDKDVTETTQQTTAVSIPKEEILGFGSNDQEDLIIPRATLLQALSPEIVDRVKDPTTNEELKVGDIINNVSKEILPAVFMPIFQYKNWIRFNPRKKTDPGYDPNYETSAIIWRSNDPNDPKVLGPETKFGPNGETPIAITYMNFLCLFEGYDSPVVISFSKTSYKAGKQLYSLAKLTRQHMFSRKYLLGAKKETKNDDTYFVFNINCAGICTPEECLVGKQYYQELHPKKDIIQVHNEADEQVIRDKNEVYAEPVNEPVNDTVNPFK